MAYRTFVVPIYHSTPHEEELNRFVASHSVLSVERRWLDDGANSAWCFCVDYEAGALPGDFKGVRVDYKEVLKPAEFQVFAKLRDLRRQIAEAEAVPVFTVFSNEQLADMVRKSVRSAAELGAISGVGEVKLKKYGERFLQVLSGPPPGNGASD